VRQRLLETFTRRLLSLLLGLFSALLLLALKLHPTVGLGLGELEATTYDYRMQSRPTRQLREDLLLVGLTDFDLDRWHTDIDTRAHHFRLLQTLSNLGVDAVLFDIVFVDRVSEEQIQARGGDVTQDYRGDDDLGFQMLMTKTFLPYFFYIRQRYPEGLAWLEERQDLVDESWFLPYEPAMGGEFGEDWDALKLKVPSPPLAESAQGLGHINVISDSDGVVRAVPLVIRYEHPTLGLCLFPSVSLRHVLDRLGVEVRDLRIRFGDSIEFDHGDPPETTRIPIDEHGQMLINFREGAAFTHRGLSTETMMLIAEPLSQWINLPPGERAPLDQFEIHGHIVERAEFEGATVLVGEIAVASTDIRATSIDRALPMITVHANVINSLLSGDFVHRAPPWTEPLLSILIGLIAGHVFSRVGYMRSFVTSLLIAGGFVSVTWLAFHLWSVWLPVVLPMLTLLLSGILILFYHVMVEDRRRRIIRSAFEAYTSPEVVDVILQNIDDPALWGAKRRVTTLFVDIRGFTTMTEKSPPEIIVEILNEYYQVAVEAIRRHGGIPNKFIGDEIMALFNAPHSMENPEEAACRAAVDIQLDVARLNRERLVPDLSREIRCGVGINTGEVIVGIVGREKIEYTALGDDVNIASRLQGHAQPEQVLIGQATHEALQRTGAEFLKATVWQVRHIPELVLKGLTRRFDVYELCYERRTRARA
jgi:class 3 adenylate cyclase